MAERKSSNPVDSPRPRPALKDLPQRQGEALKVSGGTTRLMLACASGQHFKESTFGTEISNQ